ncbi:MAG: ribonuclease P protein component [Actinobacteria bacterium]|nr:ribonuclease P protein component [Actinomycetota bacterium]
MLPARSRLRNPGDFRDTLRQGVRCGRATLVVHARRSPVADGAGAVSRAGFIVSKAVGNAVRRNRVKRRLRHAAAAALPSAPFGVDVVVRALPPSAVADDLAGEFRLAFATCLDRLAA